MKQSQLFSICITEETTEKKFEISMRMMQTLTV